MKPACRSCLAAFFIALIGVAVLAADPKADQLLRQKPAEAANEMLSWPADQRREGLRALLRQPDPRGWNLGLSVLERSFDLALMKDLQTRLDQGGARLPRTRIENLLKDLALYQPIAVNEPAPVAATKAAPNPADAALTRRFRPVAVRVRVLRPDGQAADGVGVRAYADDFGVSVPGGNPSQPGPGGIVNLELFPGRWTLFAAGASGAGQGFYLCKPAVEITGDRDLTLQADRTITLLFADLAAGQELDEVLIADSAFSAFLPYGRLGKTSQGALRLLTGPQRPLDLIGIKQPSGGAGQVRLANRALADASGRVTIKGGGTATLAFAAAPNSPPITKAQIELRLNSLQRPEVLLTGTPPFQVQISSGFADLAYTIETAQREALSFHARGYSLAAGEQRRFSLGGPYASSIFHQFYRQFQHATNMTAFYLFASDANGHILERYRSTERGQSAPPIAVEVVHANKVIFDSTAPGKLRSRQFVSEVEGLSPKVNLDAELEYRVRLPFTGETNPRQLKGHGQDVEITTKHFRFKGPHEVAASATNWFQGAEFTYAAMAKLLGHDTRKREQGAEQGIQINAMMPVGVGAFASGGNTTFPVDCALALTRPTRILNVPFSHELLHTFGHGHKDYMGLTCRETAVTWFQGSSAARYVGNNANNEESLRALQGKIVQNHERLLGPMLMEAFGYSTFLRYFAEGRPRRDQLWAADLTELETDCALFDSYTGNRARAIFQSLGVPMRLAMVDRGVSLLKAGPAKSDTQAATSARREFNQALRSLRETLARNETTAAAQLTNRLKQSLEAINDQRFVADMYAVAGEIYFKHEQKLPAHEMLKECQRAAAMVSPGFFLNARTTCLKILKGQAIRTLQ